MCLRVNNTGKSAFGTANDRVEAKTADRRGFSVVMRWGALSTEGKKLDCCSKVIIGFPVSLSSALVKC